MYYWYDTSVLLVWYKYTLSWLYMSDNGTLWIKFTNYQNTSLLSVKVYNMRICSLKLMITEGRILKLICHNFQNKIRLIAHETSFKHQQKQMTSYCQTAYYFLHLLILSTKHRRVDIHSTRMTNCRFNYVTGYLYSNRC